LVGLGLGATVGLALTAETRSALVARGGGMTFLGNITGLVGTYLALVMVLLVSRLPFVERILGQDGLLRWHRRLGPWPISLLIAHAILTTLGYAEAAKTGFAAELGVFVDSYPGMLTATVGLVLMIVAGTASIRAIRTRLQRETWWMIHLCLYLALALSIAHIIALGPSFVGHPFTQVVWSLTWIATAGLVLVFRIGMPVARSLRHRLRVVSVYQEAPGVVSVVCEGRQLERLAVAGGQFISWRFLAPGLWWQAHPYSLSALPQPPMLRLTVKQVGDHSAAVARIRPGTRVAIEGPYGAFTAEARRLERVVLVAGGIGITAIRSLLEDLPSRSRPTVIVRATSEDHLVFRVEIRTLVKRNEGRLYELVGARDEVRLDCETLKRLVPDLRTRDLYVCGPPGFVDDVVSVARMLGIADESIHHEAFAW
jgi:predicted ferric reductase